ncbi:MAG TPA: hypothetical protein VJS44_20650 [Pyrinomonadaceae bacterium]|nr:hypothetical protein [Pyrinomonadaceae bacterium]
MKILKSMLLLLLLAVGAAAQQAPVQSAPGVEVIQITWRRVSGGDPRLSEAPLTQNPERAGRVAVNQARVAAYESARQQGNQVPAPVLLDVPSAPTITPPAVRPWNGFVYEFTVRNSGTKTIKKIAWEYSFVDPSTGRKVGKRQYKSNVKIRPGMTAKLTVRSSLPPIGTVNARQAGLVTQDQKPEQMVIENVKYDDGSVWKRNSK